MVPNLNHSSSAVVSVEIRILYAHLVQVKISTKWIDRYIDRQTYVERDRNRKRDREREANRSIDRQIHIIFPTLSVFAIFAIPSF